MTYEKAHDAVVSTIADGLITARIEDYDFWYIVKEALEKQIPMKPKITLHGTTDYNTKCFCPSCGKFIRDTAKFCDNCGQAIDWTSTGGKNNA